MIEASTIISAVGQQPDYEPVLSGLASGSKALSIDRETLQANVDGVFAAGDFVTGPSTVVEAMASGKKAAQAVDRYLEAKENDSPQSSAVRRRKSGWLNHVN